LASLWLTYSDEQTVCYKGEEGKGLDSGSNRVTEHAGLDNDGLWTRRR